MKLELMTLGEEKYHIQETYSCFIQSTCAFSPLLQQSLDGFKQKASAKRTDWIVCGKVFEETTLFSECKHCCIAPVWTTLKD